MELYLYSVQMPFSGIKIYYRELTSREQIHLSKANTMMPFSQEFADDYGRVLREVVANCVKNVDDFYKLNVLEYIMFLCKLRIVSIGEELELQFLNEDNIKVKNTLNLSKMMLDLYNTTKDLINNSEIALDNLSVKLNWPLLNCESFFLNHNDDYIFNSVPMFIESLSTDLKKICLKSFNSDQRIELYNKLPTKFQTQIQNAVFEIIKKYNDINIFTGECSKFLNLNFYNISYQNLIRLFFVENLESLYHLYYILASKHISPDYIDKMSISERNVYFSFLQEETTPEEPNLDIIE